ncbi:hypothetical protein KKG05_10115 [bacterium]|nr:hypothetical protein [bacterium]MBU1937740.1 hypothetical protein [bacterium]
MRFRVLLGVFILLALTTFAFGQASVQFLYVPPNSPVTDDGCFASSPIPDGTLVSVYKGESLLGTSAINGGAMGMGEGLFMLNYISGVPGSDWWVQIVSEGCTYTSTQYTTVSGPQGIQIPQGDWSCNCGNPGCEVIEEYSEQSP